MKIDSNFSWWQRLGLRMKLLAISGTFSAIMLGVVGYTVITVERQKMDSVLSDLAGRQRMLGQKYMKEILLAASGDAANFQETGRVLSETLSALLGGGTAVENLATGRRVTVPPAPTPELQAKLTEQMNLLNRVKHDSEIFLRLPEADPRKYQVRQELLNLQAQMVSVADEAVKMYSRHSESKIASMIMWEMLIGGLVVLASLSLSWLVARSIAMPLERCVHLAESIAEGDLRHEKLVVPSGDEVGVLTIAFNNMLTSLREITMQIRTASENINSAVAQIFASNQEQAASTKQQAAAVQEITSTIEEISQSGKQVTEKSRQIASAAEAVSASGVSGLNSVNDTVKAMEAIRDQAETVAENIVALSERTQAIGEIIVTVNDIAEQSNLVALNAAIEAADARDSGRRFSVVATEIKNLADQAKEATGQVRSILEQTQKGINTSVMLTEEALKRVEVGREKTGVAEQVIRQMSDNIQDSVHAFQQIVGATNQQQIGLEQVTQALHEIRQATMQTAASTGELERASSNLNQLSQQLYRSMEKYRL
jgi:methyl-accepting chemotaxis protein